MSHYEELSLVDFIVHDNEQYFVGLKYDYAVNEAPLIVFISSDNGYEKVARLQGVTAVYAPYIAKALSDEGVRGQEIPEFLFTSVAHICAEYQMLKDKKVNRISDYSECKVVW
jgi:flagellar biosynthesis protein FlhB